MKTFFLSILTIILLGLFMYSSILVLEILITSYNTKVIEANRIESGCYVKHNILHCNF